MDMDKIYKGAIIEESLEDNRILNTLDIIDFKITDDEKPEDRWHIYTVKISKDKIINLSKCIKSGTWYMHFWKDREVIAVFRDKIFNFNYD